MQTETIGKDCGGFERRCRKMADEAKNTRTLGKRGNGDPRLGTLESLYYDYTSKK
jgi:hypothetical protein